MPNSPNSSPSPAALLQDRLDVLVRAFRLIGATRMQGVPMMHPELQVEAVGFELHADAGDDGCMALGILITPWFMNLVLLPLGDTTVAAMGRVRRRRIGGERFEFIGADEASFGPYEMCSLFSPMFEFADHAAARATAVEVLAVLRTPPTLPPAIPSRRAFLTGRVRPDAGVTR